MKSLEVDRPVPVWPPLRNPWSKVPSKRGAGTNRGGSKPAMTSIILSANMRRSFQPLSPASAVPALFSRPDSAMLPMFRRSRRPSIQEARLPDGVRVYAIGDIHGSVGLLHRLHDRILADSHTAPAGFNVLIYLGDYIDRRLDSRGVLDILAAGPLPGFEAVYLKGNHEAALLE